MGGLDYLWAAAALLRPMRWSLSFQSAREPNRGTMHPIKKLLAVVLFLAVLFLIFQLSGLREHFSLAFLQQKIAENRVTGLLIFILLFSLGNLIQIPGWVFLAAAVLTLGRSWAPPPPMPRRSFPAPSPSSPFA